MTRIRESFNHIRVIIADDHPAIAAGLAATLQHYATIEVVGRAQSFAEVLHVLAVTPADVLILDLLGMHGSPLQIIPHILAHHPSLAIVVYSSSVTLAPELLHAGVLGYVVKDELLDHLVRAIDTVVQRKPYLSPSVQAYLDRTANIQQTVHLSPKEQLALKLLTQGCNTAEIAAQMGIGTRTVLNYLTELRTKTGCTDRMELVDWYRQVYGDVDRP